MKTLKLYLLAFVLTLSSTLLIGCSKQPLEDKSAGEVKQMVIDWDGQLLLEQKAARKAGKKTQSVDLFYKVFGKPKDKSMVGDDYYFYYECKDGTVQLRISQPYFDRSDQVLIHGDVTVY